MSSVDGSVTASPNFEAWYFHPDGTTEPLTCPQGTFTTSGNFAACCEKGKKCPMPTACSDNKLSYENFAVAACGGSASCQTMSILSAPGDKGAVTSSIFCAQYWYALEVYRDTVPVSTSSSTQASKSTKAPSAGSSPTSNSASMTTSLSSTTSSPVSSGAGAGTTSPAASPSPSPESSSKAWIAGAVVGPVAGLALIGLGFWLFRRNAQKKKNAAATAPQEIGGYERPAGDGQWENKQYYGASHPKTESTTAGYYAPVQQNQVHELPGGGSR